jgi:hypothetical protein
MWVWRTSVLAALMVTALVLVAAGPAAADVSEAVQKKLKGKMYLAAEPISLDGDGDAEVVKNLEKHARPTIKHHAESDGVASWRIAFVAFMNKKPGVSQVSLDFYTDDAKKAYVANKRLTGISPDIALLASEIDISEDDGLTRGRSYVVKLTATVKGKDVVLSTASLKTK